MERKIYKIGKKIIKLEKKICLPLVTRGKKALDEPLLDPLSNKSAIDKNIVASSPTSDSSRGDGIRRRYVTFRQLSRLSGEDRFRQSVIFRQLGRLSPRSREEISGRGRDVVVANHTGD